jgi:hypothetical protein
MKSITKKISLLLMLSAVLFLSSCLDSGSNSYIGNEEYSYITSSQTSGIVYARTIAGYMITSPKIQQLTPGTAAFLTYQVTDETPTVVVEEGATAFKVNLGAEPKTIERTILFPSNAPEAPIVKFENLMEPVFARNDFFGDLWLFPYTYSIKKGENVNVTFHKAEQSESDVNSNYIIIDVRMTVTGTPEENASSEIKGDYITVDMSSLRMTSAQDADVSGNLNIKFRFYRSDHDGLYTSNKMYSMLIDKE